MTLDPFNRAGRSALAKLIRAEGARVGFLPASGCGAFPTGVPCGGWKPLDANPAGVPADQAVGWVRTNYDPRAIETPAREQWLQGFAGYI